MHKETKKLTYNPGTLKHIKLLFFFLGLIALTFVCMQVGVPLGPMLPCFITPP